MMEQQYPIRILHVIGIMNRGGAETMIMNLYRRIDRSKVQFDFVEHTDGTAVFDEEILTLGGKIYHCPRFTGKNYFIYRNWWKLFFQKEGNKYDIVHGHIGSTAAIYLSAAKKYGKYTIVHSHNTKGPFSAKEMAYRLMSEKVLKVADCFFACSVPAGNDRFGSKTAFKVINNAIDSKKYAYSHEIRKEVREEFHLKDEFIIGHVGRFSPQKNHSFLVDIFYHIKKEMDNARLLLVGEGNDLQKIKQKIDKSGLTDSVIFTGVRSDVDRLMQAMDIFVFPSLFEGLPVTLVEAQASGLPCVISSKVPEDSIITNGLVTVKNPGNPVQEWAKCICEKKSIERCDTSEQIKARGFDIKETAKWLEDFYLGVKEK